MFEMYKDNFKNINLERSGGVLEVRLHTRGGPMAWGFKDHTSLHAQLGRCFYEIAHDPENKVVILTGTGDVFVTGMDEQDGLEGDFTPLVWERLVQEGRDMLMNFLDIGAVVISAVNGPATFHPELPTLADIVIASENAVFADPHMSEIGAVPGHGGHVWWPMLLGPNRGRHFLLTGEQISAQEARQLGFVAEVLTSDELLPRAREIAQKLAKHPGLALRYAHNVLTQDIKRRLLNDLHFGFALEGLSGMLTHGPQAAR